MKKSLIISMSIFVSLLFTSASGFCADKIGIVDFQKILTTSSPGKIAAEEMNKKAQEMEEDVKKREQELIELQKKLEREALVMGKEKSEEKKREMRIKANDYKTLKANYMKEFKQIQARNFNKIKNEVLEITDEYGKKHGYHFIIEKNEGGIMYYSDAIDITDKIIKEYNKTASAK